MRVSESIPPYKNYFFFGAALTAAFLGAALTTAFLGAAFFAVAIIRLLSLFKILCYNEGLSPLLSSQYRNRNRIILSLCFRNSLNSSLFIFLSGSASLIFSIKSSGCSGIGCISYLSNSSLPSSVS